MSDHPKVFISYSWANKEYKETVLRLAEYLMSKGVDVILDQWDLKPGQDMYAFMEQSIVEADKVLVLCDKTYTDKADDRKGGVGTETQIITPEVYNNCKQEKFIPVVMESFEYIPVYLKSRLAIDLTPDNRTPQVFDYLLDIIRGLQTNKKPELGIPSGWDEPPASSGITYEPESWIRPVIGVGEDHAVAVFKKGHVRATGLNEEQQCNVHSWRNIVSVVGCQKGTVGLRSDGTCVSIGENVIEDGTLFRWKDISALAAGTFHVLGLKKDGTAVSFGRNTYGECNVSEWKNLVGIAAGDHHSVGLMADGTVVAKGTNDQGQCEVHQWKNVKQIAASGNHTLALLHDGTVVGCGNLKSIKMDQMNGAKAIATGLYHAVGLFENGCVVNTGASICGLMDVERWHNMIAIAAGFTATIGVRSDGRVFVTNDPHKSYYMDTASWKLFEDKNSEIAISKFDESLSQFKRCLSIVKEQALKISPYVSEYHANVKVLDFSSFNGEYKKLQGFVSEVVRLRESCLSMPTIENISTFLIAAAMDVYETIEERDGRCYITDKTYDPFLIFIDMITKLETEVRLIEDGLSYSELIDQQSNDFSDLMKKIPTWK